MWPPSGFIKTVPGNTGVLVRKEIVAGPDASGKSLEKNSISRAFPDMLKSHVKATSVPSSILFMICFVTFESRRNIVSSPMVVRSW